MRTWWAPDITQPYCLAKPFQWLNIWIIGIFTISHLGSREEKLSFQKLQYVASVFVLYGKGATPLNFPLVLMIMAMQVVHPGLSYTKELQINHIIATINDNYHDNCPFVSFIICLLFTVSQMTVWPQSLVSNLFDQWLCHSFPSDIVRRHSIIVNTQISKHVDLLCWSGDPTIGTVSEGSGRYPNAGPLDKSLSKQCLTKGQLTNTWEVICIPVSIDVYIYLYFQPLWTIQKKLMLLLHYSTIPYHFSFMLWKNWLIFRLKLPQCSLILVLPRYGTSLCHMSWYECMLWHEILPHQRWKNNILNNNRKFRCPIP